MQSCVNETERTMRALLDAVEEKAQLNSEQVTDNRAEPRRPLHVESSLCYFTSEGEIQQVNHVFARNITFLGLSLLGVLPPEVVPGHPVEAIVKPMNHTPTYLAGLVVFRRAVSGDCHEIGISVKAAGCAAVLVNDIPAALKRYEWFKDAMAAHA